MKETMGTWVTTEVSAITSHVHYLGVYEGVQMNIIWKGLNFVTTLFQKY